MKVVFLSCVCCLFLSACNIPSQWVKPGSTEEDLAIAIDDCNRDYVSSRFARQRSEFPAPEYAQIQTSQPNMRRGAANMALERCLEGRGWQPNQ